MNFSFIVLIYMYICNTSEIHVYGHMQGIILITVYNSRARFGKNRISVWSGECLWRSPRQDLCLRGSKYIYLTYNQEYRGFFKQSVALDIAT